VNLVPSAVESGLRTKFVGRRIVYLESTHSTMDVARKEALKGIADGTCVLADEQTGGRGRFGRTWVSPPGQNIYLTLVLRPRRDRLRMLGVISPLAVCLALEEKTGLKPSVKWPNDVRVGERKISGILIENEFSGSRPICSLVGIGVNVNFEPVGVPEIADIATSVKQETGKEWVREELIASLLNQLEALYLDPDVASVVDRWKSRLDTLGRNIAVSFRGQQVEGVAEDVTPHGDLLLRRSDGTVETIVAGEVTLRPDSR
jgi:BirA family biotin operon repressor/biotin-[acetyl-CoA-carboxylase] ligase